MRKLIVKFGGVIASFGLMIVSLNVNTTCMFFIHQAKLPKGTEKLRKYNV